MKQLHGIVRILIIISVIVSCTPQKNLVYFNNISTGIQSAKTDFKYTLRAGDLINVTVYSANEKAPDLFRPNGANSANMNSEVNMYLNGFVVSDSGQVNLPLIGKIDISGKTIEETTLFIQKLIREYFFDAIVDVKLLNFQVTVLGEVNRPGTYLIYDSKMNILEAIALAGDLTVYGKRDITLIRETSVGFEIYKVDLKDRNLMSHECFYLLPNDILYIEPHKAKVFGFNTVPLTTILSAITTLVLVLNVIK
jgi:polysaccharide biosynthesis/export protein